jgi:hypothetical protein
MNTVSQNSLVNSNINSQSSKKSATIEKLPDCPRGKIPADNKKRTPATKQAKRDKASKETWKNKAIQRACDINAKDKTIAEIRESRDKSRIKAIERVSEIELLRSQVKEERQNYIDEQLRLKENREQNLLQEAKSLEAYAKLEKVVEVLQESNKRITEIFNSQSNFQEKIRQLNIEINIYTHEKHYSQDSEQTIGMSKKIGEEIVEINRTLKQMEAEIKTEAVSLKEKTIKIDGPLHQSLYSDLLNLYQAVACQTKGALDRLKNVQVNLSASLKVIKEKFTNKKNRQGGFQTHEHANNYSYSIGVIHLVLLYILYSATSFRAAAKAMKVNSLFFDTPSPSHTVINDWSKKIGFFVYHQPKDKTMKSLWIIDFSIQIGKNKLMLVLRMDLDKIKNWKQHQNCKKNKKPHLKICFKDVEVIHMKILEKTAYEFTLSELEQIVEKCGLPLFILSDEGSDLAKGIRIFIEKNPGIQHLNDISHKISNILKGELEDNLKWKEFCQVITKMKQRMTNTIIAHMCPPKLRQKMRFLNIRNPIEYAFKMLNINIDSLPKNERKDFITYIKKPLEAFKDEIIQWYEVTSFITEVETEIKHNGLTRGDGIQIRSTSEILAARCQKRLFSENEMKTFNQILEFVKKQEAKLSPGQTIIGSSDIIESMFGKWKSMSPEDSMAGITNKIFILPLLTVNLTVELIKKALEDTPIKKIEEWQKNTLGKTMYAKRRAILKPGKSKKVDRKLVEFPRELLEKSG